MPFSLKNYDLDRIAAKIDSTATADSLAALPPEPDPYFSLDRTWEGAKSDAGEIFNLLKGVTNNPVGTYASLFQGSVPEATATVKGMAKHFTDYVPKSLEEDELHRVADKVQDNPIETLVDLLGVGGGVKGVRAAKRAASVAEVAEPGIAGLLGKGSHTMPPVTTSAERLSIDRLRGAGPYAEEILKGVDKILPEQNVVSKIDNVLEGIPPELLEETKKLKLLPGQRGGTTAKPKPKAKPEKVEPDLRQNKVEKIAVAPDKATEVLEKFKKDIGTGEASVGGTRFELVKQGSGYGIEITQGGVTHTVGSGLSAAGAKSSALEKFKELLGLK